MAEDIGDLEARIRAASRKTSTCSICDWLEGRPDAEVWDRIMSLPTKEAWHTVIERELKAIGFNVSDSTIAAHRRSKHRTAEGG